MLLNVCCTERMYNLPVLLVEFLNDGSICPSILEMEGHLRNWPDKNFFQQMHGASMHVTFCMISKCRST